MKNSDMFEMTLLSSLQASIAKAFFSIGIDESHKNIRYIRKSNGKSMLSIKLNDGLDSDIKNYIHFGAEPVIFKDFRAVNIFVHADKAVSIKANYIINLVQDDVRSFFESFENYLAQNDIENNEYDISMPVEALIQEKSNILTRIKKLFCK